MDFDMIDAYRRINFNASISMSIDWQSIFGGFEKKSIRSMHRGFNTAYKTDYEFLTGSVYKGQWNSLGMSGVGIYTFPHKVKYDGHFDDGTFHREGTLFYPMGQTVEGFWHQDSLLDYHLVFKDLLEYTPEEWNYCTSSDRRFWISHWWALRPGGRELITNDQTPREIPEGFYDTGDGFFNPKTKCVVSTTDPTKILRIVTKEEEDWIIKNCRRSWEEPTGYRPDFME